MKNSKLSQGELKTLFLIALREFAGNVTQACTAANIARQTYYNWRENDEEFDMRVKLISMECAEELMDEAEQILKFALKDPKESTSTAKWLLARLGKSRGYGAKVEVEHTASADFLKNEYPDEPKTVEEWEESKE